MPMLKHPVHEKFCQLMAVTPGGRMHKRNAYREAYLSFPGNLSFPGGKPNPSEQYLSEKASIALRRQDVKDRIAEIKSGLPNFSNEVPRLQAAAAHKVGLSIEKAITEADEIQQAAMKAGQYAAATAALTAKAKLAGIWVEKSESTSAHYAISDKPLSDDEWKRKYVDGAATQH